MENKSILIVGTGSLGSEIIKLLSLMSVDLTIIDFDKIETSNMARQFYFTNNDQGDFKSKVIYEKLRHRIKGSFNYYVKNFEDFDDDFFEQFDVIFCCLDTIPGRMELNYKLFKDGISDKLIFVDSGVENLRFHIKIVRSGTPCLYCVHDLYKLTENIPLCSLSNIENDLTEEKREKTLISFVYKNSGKSIENISNLYNEIIQNKVKIKETENNTKTILFQNEKDKFQKYKTFFTTTFEVKGIVENIIPNVSTINSLCASMAIMAAFKPTENDFIFFDSMSETPNLQKIKLESDKYCFVCASKNKY